MRSEADTWAGAYGKEQARRAEAEGHWRRAAARVLGEGAAAAALLRSGSTAAFERR